MTKLLNAFQTTPTLANARKIAMYDRKHMMASALLGPAQHAILSAALAMVIDADLTARRAA